MTHRIDVDPKEGMVVDREEPVRDEDERGVRSRPDIVDAKVVEPAPASSAETSSGAPVALFPGSEAEKLRSEWQSVQTAFVDEPRRAVERADELVGRVTQRLADVFGSTRAELEKRWGQGGDASTEDLRLLLQRYRSFFDRLLSI